MKKLVCILVAACGMAVSATAQLEHFYKLIFDNEKLVVMLDESKWKCFDGVRWTDVYAIGIRNKTNNTLRVKLKYEEEFTNIQNKTTTYQQNKTFILKPNEIMERIEPEKEHYIRCDKYARIRNVELIEYSVKKENKETAW